MVEQVLREGQVHSCAEFVLKRWPWTQWEAFPSWEKKQYLQETVFLFLFPCFSFFLQYSVQKKTKYNLYFSPSLRSFETLSPVLDAIRLAVEKYEHLQ